MAASLDGKIEALAETASQRAKEAGDRLDDLAARIDAGLALGGERLQQTLTRHGLEVLRAFATGSEQATTALDEKLREFEEAVASQGRRPHGRARRADRGVVDPCRQARSRSIPRSPNAAAGCPRVERRRRARRPGDREPRTRDPAESRARSGSSSSERSTNRRRRSPRRSTTASNSSIAALVATSDKLRASCRNSSSTSAARTNLYKASSKRRAPISRRSMSGSARGCKSFQSAMTKRVRSAFLARELGQRLARRRRIRRQAPRRDADDARPQRRRACEEPAGSRCDGRVAPQRAALSRLVDRREARRLPERPRLLLGNAGGKLPARQSPARRTSVNS